MGWSPRDETPGQNADAGASGNRGGRLQRLPDQEHQDLTPAQHSHSSDTHALSPVHSYTARPHLQPPALLGTITPGPLGKASGPPATRASKATGRALGAAEGVETGPLETARQKGPAPRGSYRVREALGWEEKSVTRRVGQWRCKSRRAAGPVVWDSLLPCGLTPCDREA